MVRGVQWLDWWVLDRWVKLERGMASLELVISSMDLHPDCLLKRKRDCSIQPQTRWSGMARQFAVPKSGAVGQR
jgi:hypothetical protein